MMEETIETIDDRADVEWKFARSRLYMEYIRDGNHSFSPSSFGSTNLRRRKYSAGTDEHLPVAEVAGALRTAAETDALVVELIDE